MKVALVLLLLLAAIAMVFYQKRLRLPLLGGAAAITNTTAVKGGFGIGAPLSALWTFPTVLTSAILIAWGAEVGQFIVSQGMSLAVLAWLQVLPEFTVEAAITHDAAFSGSTGLITANFTGANRLLVGLGWPLIFFVSFYFYRRHARKCNDPHCKTARMYSVELAEDHAVEIMALIVPTLYFIIIYLKGTLNLIDSAILVTFYLTYLAILSRLPPESKEEQDHVQGVPKKVLTKSRRFQKVFVISMFLIGGGVLFLVAEPFLGSLESVAMIAFGETGVYFFIQWVAPFLSEFPEKVSAFYWARTVKFSPMAVMNMVSSTINQWTVLIAMIPMVYCISLWRVQTIDFDDFQRWEIILTVVQSLYGVTILLKMRITLYDATSLFLFWFFQFATPTLRLHAWGSEFGTHQVMTAVYIVAAVAQLVYYRKQLTFRKNFTKTWRKHVTRTEPPSPEREDDDGLPHDGM